MQLVVGSLPASLLTVHIGLAVEGRLFTSVLEADHNLTHTFVWDGRDAYGREVFGKSLARVSVGYQYKLCPDIVWTTQTVDLHGAIPQPLQDLEGWSLDILHSYNPKDGIVYKGDGTILDAMEQEKIVFAVNENFTKTVIEPQALVIDREGNFFIGDSTYIRRVNTVGRATDLLKLNQSSAQHKYYLALDSEDRWLYMSDPTNNRIIKIPTVSSATNKVPLEQNYQIVVGGSEVCLVTDPDNCGEGRPARLAKLVYPKGLAFTPGNQLVFVDGATVRQLDSQGHVWTVAGARKLASEWRPEAEACHGGQGLATEANLNWPTEIAVNPLTNALTIVDQGAVMEISLNSQDPSQPGLVRNLFSVACKGTRMEFLPKNLAYTSQGTLVLADDRNRVYTAVPSASLGGTELIEVAGSLAYCKRQENGCLRSDFDDSLTIGSKARFFGISDIAVGPDGSIYVADQARHQVRSVRTYLPQVGQSSDDQNYEVISADTQELYVFNPDGVHLQTRGLFTNVTGYYFLHDTTGLLVEVRDKNNNILGVKRDDAGGMVGFRLPNGQLETVKVGKTGNLEMARAPDNLVTIFNYLGNTGLLGRMFIGGKLQHAYSYTTEAGHFIRQVAPASQTAVTPHRGLTADRLRARENVLMRELYPEQFQLHHVLEDRDTQFGEAISQSSSNSSGVGGGGNGLSAAPTVHRIGWTYFLHTLSPRTRASFSRNVDGIGKRLMVNEALAFTSELHPRNMVQSIYSVDGIQLLKVEQFVKMAFFIPYPTRHFPWVTQHLDDQGRPTRWEWGGRRETITYDEQGRVTTVENCEDVRQSFSYSYEDSQYAEQVVGEAGEEYTVMADNSGGVQAIITPLGHTFSFWIQATLGLYSLYIQPPWLTSPVRYDLDADGNVLRRILAGSSVVYRGASQGLTVTTGTGRLLLAETFNRETEGDHVRIRLQQTVVGTSQNAVGTPIQPTVGITQPPVGSPSTSHTTVVLGPTWVELTRRFGSSNSSSEAALGYLCIKSEEKYEVTCNGSLAGHPIAYVTGYDRASHAVTRVNEFVVTAVSPQTTTYSSSGSGVEVVRRADIYGLEEKLEVKVGAVVTYSRGNQYNCLGQLVRVSIRLAGVPTPQVTDLNYTVSGQLASCHQPGAAFTFLHDANGNIGEADYGVGKAGFEWEWGERVVQGGNNRAQYDEAGRMTAKGRWRFTYNSLNQLEEVWYEERPQRRLQYDTRGRVITIDDVVRNETTSLVYILEAKPWLVTHFHRTGSEEVMTLTYSRQDLLLGLRTTRGEWVVVTTVAGSPTALIDKQGSVVKTVSYSPYGIVIDDTNDQLRPLIGFAGGVDLEAGGIVIVEGRPYDTQFGTWLVPDVDRLLQFPDQPKQVHLYRFRNNDPVNHLDPKRYDKLSEWLSYLGFDMNKMSSPILDPAKMVTLSHPRVSLPSYLTPAGPTSASADLDTLLDPAVQNLFSLRSSEQRRQPRLGRFYEMRSPLLGPNIIITRDGAKLRTLSLQGANSAEIIIAKVLNNTLELENRGDSTDLYFYKEKLENDDLEEIKRYVPVKEESLDPYGRQIVIQGGGSRFFIREGLESILPGEELYNWKL